MANQKVLAGKEPTPTQNKGVKMSNSSTRGNRNTRNTNTKKRAEKQVEIPLAGERDQVWMWRAGGSGTLTLPSTYTVTVPTENGGRRQEKIMYSEGAPDIFMSKISQYTEVPSKTPIRMYNSMLHVPKENPTLQEYLAHLVYYGGYGDIYLDDPERVAMEEAELFELEDANVETLNTMDAVALRAVAFSLKEGVDSVAPSKAVLNRIRKVNKKNPQMVAKVLEDDAQEIYFIAESVLTLRLAEVSNGSLIFEDGQTILQVPDSVTAKTHLAQQLLNDRTLRENWLKKLKDALLQEFPN